MSAFRSECGHRIPLEEPFPMERHGETVRCPECGVVYCLFIFSCGHGFPWAPESFNRYSRLGGTNDDPCLECRSTPHEPIEGSCEVCGRAISLTVGREMVCDECLPEALANTLEEIRLYAVLQGLRN